MTSPLLTATLIAMGIGQSLLFAALLVFKRPHPGAWWMALFHFAAALVMSALAVNNIAKASADARLMAHLLVGLFFLGPLLWIYAQAATAQPVAMTRRWRHFAIGLALHIALVSGLITFDPAPQDDAAWFVENYLLVQSPAEKVSTGLVFAHVGAYVVGVWVVLRRHRRRLKTEYSSIENRTFDWLSTVSTMLALGIGTWLALRSLSPVALDVAIAIFYLLLTFLAGIKGLSQIDPATVKAASQRVLAIEEPSTNALAIAPLPSGPSQDPVSQKYAKSTLTVDAANHIGQALERLMREEKLYLDEDLTLASLAAALKVTTHHLSQVLNGNMNTTLFDYVNEKRVQEVQRCLRDPAYDAQTVLEIALASGFSSKTPFNAAFKRHVGTTPSAYRNESRSRQTKQMANGVSIISYFNAQPHAQKRAACEAE